MAASTRILLLALALFGLGVMACPPAAAGDNDKLTTLRIKASVVALETQDGKNYCSGFVIDSKRRYVMTADHCMQIGPVVDGQPAVEIFHVPELDIAILESPGTKRDALKIADADPVYDEPVIAYGYANGFPVITQVSMFVTIPRLFIVGFPYVLMQFEPNAIGGMSGGPIINSDGRVVAVVQQGNIPRKLSYSRPGRIVYEATKDYWEK